MTQSGHTGGSEVAQVFPQRIVASANGPLNPCGHLSE